GPEAAADGGASVPDRGGRNVGCARAAFPSQAGVDRAAIRARGDHAEIAEEGCRVTLKRINTRYGHYYKLDGKNIDGVTTLIGNGLRKKALEAWGIKTVAEYVADHLEDVYAMRSMGRNAIVSALKQAPYSERDRAAKRGTEVHALAEQLARGEEVEVPSELAGHVEAYVKFLDEWNPVPVALERPVFSRKWWYAGTFDAVFD